MAVLPILRYPDPRLRRPADPVAAFDAALRRLAGDLLETMLDAGGVGITAPHAGIARRVVVLRLGADEPALTYVNPAIVEASAETERHLEGSVSMPGVAEDVERSVRVRVRYRDLDGAERTEEAEGFRAACHQHEIDQLDGIFWLRRLTPLRRERPVKRFERRRGA